MRLALFLAMAASLVAAAPAAAAPAIAFVDGRIQITGTTGADDFTVQASTPVQLRVGLTSGTWTQGEDSAGVCSAINESAICDVPAPVEVVVDLGAGADTFTMVPGAAAARSITATYASAPGGITYTGSVGGGAATVIAEGATDTFTRVDRLVGSAFADTLNGGDMAETLVGGAGDDTIDAARGGGPVDAVDCGDGVDRLLFLEGFDTQTACEIRNGVDSRLPAPEPPPYFVPVPPPTVLPPSYLVPPPPLRPLLQSSAEGVIDVRVMCTGCANERVAFLPPPGEMSGLPPGWEHFTDDVYFSRGQLAELLVDMANADVLHDLDAQQEQRELDDLLRRLAQQPHALGDAAERARRAAAIRQVQAVLALDKAVIQAALQQGMNPPPERTIQQLEQLLNRLHDIPTPLDGRKQAPATKVHRAAAAAARRLTPKSLTRWLLARTATALPTVRTKLKRTSKPGVYRAKLHAPRWLLATARVLRKGHVKTLPVDLKVGAAKVRVALPLPR